MSIANTIEMSAESTKGFQDAIERGVERANRTLDNVRGVWVKDKEILVGNGAITAYRATLKVTFVLND